MLIAEPPNPAEAAALIEAGLRAALRENKPPNDAQPLVIVAEEEGRAVGGLVGSTSYGWLLVKMLWVHEAMRGRGLGRQIMIAAHEQALSRGCHSAWLDTSSEPAKRFYEALGYRTFGLLENGPGQKPAGHRRRFMQRGLQPSR